TKEVSFMETKVIGLDVVAYQAAMQQIKDNGGEMVTTGRTATGTVNTTEDKMLVTTITYDAAWKAKVDGKTVEIESFRDAFLMISVPVGNHTVTFSYLPKGFMIGAFLFVLCLTLFILYVWYLKRNSSFKRVIEIEQAAPQRTSHRRRK